MRAGRWCVVAWIALCAGGCVWHLDRNAPGDVDLGKMPRQPEVEGVEVPEDPGEEVLTVRVGPFALGGGEFPLVGGEGRGLGSFGLEVSLSHFELPRSHEAAEHGELFFGGPHTGQERDPAAFISLSLGWSALELSEEQVEVGKVYVEVQRAFSPVGMPAGFAAGLTMDPVGFEPGVQLSAFWTGYTLRVTAMLDGELAVLGGMFFKIPMAWVWSR